LLNQSDIFAHFGAGKKADEPASKVSTKKAGRPEDWDEDDEALVKEVEEENAPTRVAALTQQPSCISGGTMRLLS
jgi:hypothetical protein